MIIREIMNLGKNAFVADQFIPGKRLKVIRFLAVTLALILFLAIAGRSITLPGLEYDEALHAPAAIQMIQDPISYNYEHQWEFTVDERRFPILHLTYLGSLKSYVFALTFSIFGVSVETLRFTNISLTLVGLLFIILFAKEAFGWPVAVCTAFVLATDPSLILFSRCDWGPITLSFALCSSALFFLGRWWLEGGKMLPLLAAVFLMGIGVYDKANFLWFVGAVMVGGGLYGLPLRTGR